jgi:hypothetical protein
VSDEAEMPQGANSGPVFEAMAGPVAVVKEAIESVAAPLVAPGLVSVVVSAAGGTVVSAAEGIVVFEAEGIAVFGVVCIVAPEVVFAFAAEVACYPLCFVVVLEDIPHLVVHTASFGSLYPLALVAEDSVFPLSAPRVASHV